MPVDQARGFERSDPTVVLSEADFRARTRRAFLVGGAAGVAGLLGWRWLGAQPEVDRIPALLQRGHLFNEDLWRSLHRPGALAPTFRASKARAPRVNGLVGMPGGFDPDAWSLRLEGPGERHLAVLDLDDVRRLPRREMVTELKCIEGWRELVRWTGARFSDFAARFAPAVPDAAFRYAGLATPDRGYYVGLDRETMMHPQTLLAYEMNGSPLTPPHGAPLRLVTPLKYVVKHLKRLGLVRLSTARPPDYWARRGYDWYIGH